MDIGVGGKLIDSFNQHLDPFSRAIAPGQADDESSLRHAELRQVGRWFLVPVEFMTLVDSDIFIRVKLDAAKTHFQEKAADRFADTDDSFHFRVEVCQPGVRAEKADIADNAAISDDFNR